MNKQTVLIVHNYYQIPGGEDSVVANEMQMLKNHGHKVILYSRSNQELNSIKKLCAPFFMIFNVRTYHDVKKIIRENNVNIVHVHNTLCLISPAVYYAALSMKIPVVQTVHNFRLLCPGATFFRNGHICEDCVEKGLGCAIKHKCYRNSLFQTIACVITLTIHRKLGIYRKINYICLTKFNKTKLMMLSKIEPKRFFIKPNFVNEDSLNRKLILKRKERFVYAGRLDKLKGIDILLEAWKIMDEEAPELIICGNGPLQEWCENYIKSNHINAVMKGFVSNDEVRKIVARSRALVLPTQWYEGFPMSIVEAFSVGTPVIGSNIGNVGNIIVDAVTGYKFDCKSKKSIIKAVAKILKYELNYENIAKEYNKTYSSSVNYEILQNIYKQIVNP